MAYRDPGHLACEPLDASGDLGPIADPELDLRHDPRLSRSVTGIDQCAAARSQSRNLRKLGLDRSGANVATSNDDQVVGAPSHVQVVPDHQAEISSAQLALLESRGVTQCIPEIDALPVQREEFDCRSKLRRETGVESY